MLFSFGWKLQSMGRSSHFIVFPSEILDLFRTRGSKLISREKPTDSISARQHAEELFLFQEKVIKS